MSEIEKDIEKISLLSSSLKEYKKRANYNRARIEEIEMLLNSYGFFEEVFLLVKTYPENEHRVKHEVFIHWNPTYVDIGDYGNDQKITLSRKETYKDGSEGNKNGPYFTAIDDNELIEYGKYLNKFIDVLIEKIEKTIEKKDEDG